MRFLYGVFLAAPCI